MADDRIDIVFGARVNEAIAGVEQVKGAIEGLAAPIQGFIGNLRGIAEAIAVAFAIDKIAEFAESMSKLGEDTANTAYALGLGVEQYVQFNEALKITGGSAEDAMRVLMHLGQEVQKVRQGNEQAIVAFQNLGIAQQTVRRDGDNLVKLFLDILSASDRLKNDFATTGATMELLGRGSQKLAGALREGRQGFQELMEATEEHAKLMARSVGGMTATDDAIDALKLHLNSLKVEGFNGIKAAVDDFIILLDAIIQKVREVIRWLIEMNRTMTSIGAIYHEFFTGDVSGLRDWQIRMLGGDVAPIEPRPPRGGASAGIAKAGGKSAGADTRLSEWRDELRQMLQEEQNFLSDSTKVELDYWQKKLALVSGGSKEDLKLRRDVNHEIFTLQKKLAQQEERDAIELQNYHQRLYDVGVSAERAHLQSLENLGVISGQERIAEEQHLLDEQLKRWEEYYQKKVDAAANDLREQLKIDQEWAVNQARIRAERRGLEDQAKEQTHKDIEDFFSPIKSAISSSMQGVAMGTQTFSQATAHIGQAVFGQVLDKVMGKLIDKLIVKTVENLFQQIASDVANTGILAGLLSWIGAATTAEAANPIGLHGGIASAAGGWKVPATGGMARLHPNEMVLPEHISNGLQAMIAQGGNSGNATFHINAIDTRSGTEFLMANGPAIANSWRSAGMQAHFSSRSIASTGRFP